jgi:hypothetical protein
LDAGLGIEPRKTSGQCLSGCHSHPADGRAKPKPGPPNQPSRNAAKGFLDPPRTESGGHDNRADRSRRQKGRLDSSVKRREVKTTCPFSFRCLFRPGAGLCQLPTPSFMTGGTLQRGMRQTGQSHQGIGILQGALRRGARAPRTPPRPQGIR